MTNRSIKKVLKEKKSSKQDLSSILSLNKKKPLLGLFLDKDLSPTLEKTISTLLDGAKALNLEVVILCDNDLNNSYPDHIKYLAYNMKNRKTLLEAADFALSFDFNDVEEMLIHGTIPISIYRDEILNYNPNKETGNSFIFRDQDMWSIYAAIVRATETFKFPYDWKHIIKEGLDSVCNEKI